MKKLIAAMMLITAFSFSVWAGVFEGGQAAYERKDYATAVAKFTTAAQQGSDRAQFWLGYMYDEGLGVDQDYAEALRLYRMAADQGHDLALLHIGYMYENGRGVAQNDAEALRWSRLAAAQGFTGVQPLLMQSIASPRDFSQDSVPRKTEEYRDALRLYTTLAEQGDVRAQTNLGLMYLYGKGIERDTTESARWLKMAALQSDPRAQMFLGVLHLGNEDYPEAENWLRMSAAQGFAEAQLALGTLFLMREEIKINEDGGVDINTEAVHWLKLAAENGNALAKYFLADQYFYGQDFVEAVRWRILLAEQSFKDAELEFFIRGIDAVAENFRALGYAYQRGMGVEQNYLEAVRWFNLAAERGDVQAQMHLGDMYQQGRFVTKNYVEALRWFNLAATQGLTSVTINISCITGTEQEALLVDDFTLGSQTAANRCMFSDVFADKNLACTRSSLGVMFGIMYDEGYIVARDSTEAVRWYKLAAEQGNASAQRRLGEIYSQGLGVAQDFIQAYMWFYILSISQSGESAEDLLDPVAKKMKPQQIDRARKSASEWFARNKSQHDC